MQFQTGSGALSSMFLLPMFTFNFLMIFYSTTELAGSKIPLRIRAHSSGEPLPLVNGEINSSDSMTHDQGHSRSFYRDDEIIVDRDGIPHYTGEKPELFK